MKITRGRFFRYTLPLARPLLLRDVPLPCRDGIVVGIETDSGLVGYGDIAPLPAFSAESLREAIVSARLCIGFLKQRQDVSETRPAALRYGEQFPPSVRFGIETALLDIAARAGKCAPAHVMSASVTGQVPICALLSGPRDEILERAHTAQAEGFTALKVKIGGNPLDDEIAMVRELRDTVESGVEMRLDANRAWSYDQALGFLTELAEAGISYVEEPLGDPRLLAKLIDESPVPIAVDETLQEAGWGQINAWRKQNYLGPYASALADEDPLLRAITSARVWVVKPTLVGWPLAFLAQLLTNRNYVDADLVVSSSFESGLGINALVNLAACAGERALPAGLDTASWMASDILGEGSFIQRGTIDLEKANAHTRAFSPDALEEIPDD